MGKRLKMIDVANKEVTFEDAFEAFVADKELLGCAKSTIRNYKLSYDYFIDFEFDGDYTKNVNDDNLKIYVQQWAASMKKAKMRISSINHYLRDLRTFLYWCMNEERRYIETSFKIELLKGQEELPKMFTDEEVEILMQKPTNTTDWVEWRNWTIVNWVLATGNRAQTICNVKIGDIDFTNKELALRHTKNKKAQIAVLPEELAKVLKEYIKRCMNGRGTDDWFFPAATGNQLSVDALSHSFGKYCKERGVERTNLHGLRHYFATSWIRNGGSGDKLQRALGHTDYSMTKRYINLVDADLKEDYEKFNPLSNLKRNASRKHNVSMKE